MTDNKQDQHFDRDKMLEKMVHTRQSAYSRFPLLFTILGTFGLVATLSGVQRVIEKTPLLSDNPIILIIFGLFTLTVTGTLYKKLG